MQWNPPVRESKVGLPEGGTGTLVGVGWPQDRFDTKHTHWQVKPTGISQEKLVEVCVRWIGERFVTRKGHQCEFSEVHQ